MKFYQSRNAADNRTEKGDCAKQAWGRRLRRRMRLETFFRAAAPRILLGTWLPAEFSLLPSSTNLL